jgi:DNA-binding response OmpR family regulator
MGDFAIRAFASLESLQNLARLNKYQLPKALIVDLRSNEWSTSKLVDLSKVLLAKIPIIAVGTSATNTLFERDSVHFYSESLDGLSFTSFIRQILSDTADYAAQSLVRYKSLTFDSERSRLWLSIDSQPISLPLKESQLLRLLLARRGQCLSRQEIQSSIWPEIKVTPRTIDSHVSRLRRKMTDSGIEIRSVYGGGYTLR